MTDDAEHVGPVLTSGRLADAIVDAIRQENGSVAVLDRGSYCRVLVSARCVLTRQAIERRLGRPFALPEELERIMPSFKGRLKVGPDRVEWIGTEPECVDE